MVWWLIEPNYTCLSSTPTFKSQSGYIHSYLIYCGVDGGKNLEQDRSPSGADQERLLPPPHAVPLRDPQDPRYARIPLAQGHPRKCHQWHHQYHLEVQVTLP